MSAGTAGRPGRPVLLGALHLWVLASFAVAQPTFDVLSRNPAFFVAHSAGLPELVGLTLLLVLAVPLPLILLFGLSALLGARVPTAVLVTLVGLLVALTALPPLRGVLDGPGAAVAGLALLIGAGAAAAYATVGGVRTALTVLLPAPLVFAGLFLFASPVARLLSAPSGEVAALPGRSDTTVVLLVFDELPVSSLLRADLTIDAERYPNFAALAERGTWYRDTTTVHIDTHHAVPALLDGVFAPKGADTLPTADDHPRSLLAALSGTHRVNAWESFTDVCPPAVCDNARRHLRTGERLQAMAPDVAVVYARVVAPDEWARSLPPVTDRWAGFGQEPQEGADGLADPRYSGDEVERFRAFLDGIEADAPPTLHFLHTLLPHQPWLRLPSGSVYDDSPKPPGIQDDAFWPEDQHMADAALRRHLLQVQFTDSLLGEALSTLEDRGLFDDALVVVAADHGVSFAAGTHHRAPTGGNLPDIARVPLFIKAPGQQEGGTDDRPAMTVDLAPTVLDILGLEAPWEFDGVSLVDPDVDIPPDRPRRLGTEIMTSTASAEVPVEPTVVHIHQRFPGPDGGVDPFAAEGLSAFLGQPVTAVDIGEPPGLSAELDDDGPRAYDPADGWAPAMVSGRLLGDEALLGDGPLPVVVALNGSVATAGWTYPYDGDLARFDLVLPEELLVPGDNTVELYLADDPAVAAVLRPL